MSAERLNAEFEAWCRKEHERWTAMPGNNAFRPWFVYNPGWMFDKLPDIKRRWIAHIDPLSEAWWKKRGYQYKNDGKEATIQPLSEINS